MRETGVIRKGYGGDTDTAAMYTSMARTQLGILKNLMSFQNLQQLSRIVTLANGVVITVKSIFGQDSVNVYVPPAAQAAEAGDKKIVSAVNQVVDYVAMAMPNPVPYRGVSIGTAGNTTYVMASDGTVLASELYANYPITTPPGSPSWPWNYYKYLFNDQLTSSNPVWNGGGSVWAMQNDFSAYFGVSNYTYQKTVPFTVPEDCIYPVPSATPVAYFGDDFGTEVNTAWNADWTAGVAAFNLRRKAWFKKNSDEFIAALRTGFAPDAPGVTRAELKTGKLTASWEYQIKRDVDRKYNSYSPTNTIGRKTKRAIQYNETAYSETVESDTSADLTQAGVKVTKRAVTLQYTIPVTQPDGTVEDEIRSANITGYLTQTVTRHDDADGNQLALSQNDVYDNWYNREATTLPTGVPSTITAPYLKDRTTSRIGVALNGTVQTGYNADSLLGTIGNPLDYVLYNPAYPAASSTVTATVPEFITTWHKDAKITYDKDGVGASNTLNDSAMYGVVEVHLTPIGVVTTESLGIFPDATTAQDATQIEMFGTAVYGFNWQTGVFTFRSWQSLHDADGNEVASKVYGLPSGFVWSDYPNNCLVTYKWANDRKGVTTQWPDVAAALVRRNSALQASDPVLYSLIQAKKAG